MSKFKKKQCLQDNQDASFRVPFKVDNGFTDNIIVQHLISANLFVV